MGEETSRTSSPTSHPQSPLDSPKNLMLMVSSSLWMPMSPEVTLRTLLLTSHPQVTNTHGDSAIRVLTTTFSTLSPSTSLMSLQSGSYSAFISSVFFFSSSVSRSKPSLVTALSFLPSYSLSCWTAYSSIGSIMYTTSKPFLRNCSMNGELDTCWMLSPVM